jgi:hypothetical protein
MSLSLFDECDYGVNRLREVEIGRVDRVDAVGGHEKI